MDVRIISLLLVCIAAAILAGCTTQPAAPVVTATTLPVPPVPAILPETTTPQAIECTRYSDCVPAECCHPSRCIPSGERKQVCNLMCTRNCEGPLDCGAGSCGCTAGRCSVIPAGKPPAGLPGNTSITLRAAPAYYSPIMSSTPGIGLEPAVTGFSPANASFAWNTSYGHFLTWNSPDYTISEKGDTVTNHGEKLYWTFAETPGDTTGPVIISVSATDISTGRLLGTSRVILSWKGNYSVNVSAVE